MPSNDILRIYLEPAILEMARAGDFGFVNKIRAAFEGRAFEVALVEDTDAERRRSTARRGYALFLMKDPFHPRALSMRRAYYYPYWRIEPTAKRWAFGVARKTFDPAQIDPDIALGWFHRWRQYLFRKAPMNALRAGLIYVPLQGRLLAHRSFQTMSPVDMIAEVQARAGARRILLGLHPGETYSPAETAAIERIAASDPRVSVQTGGMDEALRVCDFVITQNSAAALSGFFFGKPALLFAESDFHHAMPRVSQFGVNEAWRKVEEDRPPVARYLYWFIHQNAIKADTDEAEAQIIKTCRSHGWEV